MGAACDRCHGRATFSSRILAVGRATRSCVACGAVLSRRYTAASSVRKLPRRPLYRVSLGARKRDLLGGSTAVLAPFFFFHSRFKASEVSEAGGTRSFAHTRQTRNPRRLLRFASTFSLFFFLPAFDWARPPTRAGKAPHQTTSAPQTTRRVSRSLLRQVRSTPSSCFFPIHHRNISWKKFMPFPCIPQKGTYA